MNFSVIILNSAFRIPDSGFWFLDSGFRIPVSGFRLLGLPCWNLVMFFTVTVCGWSWRENDTFPFIHSIYLLDIAKANFSVTILNSGFRIPDFRVALVKVQEPLQTWCYMNTNIPILDPIKMIFYPLEMTSVLESFQWGTSCLRHIS